MLCIYHHESNLVFQEGNYLMSSLPRTQTRDVVISYPPTFKEGDSGPSGPSVDSKLGTRTSKLWLSEGHRANPRTGKYESGGPFHVTHSGPYFRAGSVSKAYSETFSTYYSGPVLGQDYKGPLFSEYDGVGKEQDTSSLNSLGATAIAQCAPVNPTANLGTTLAESFREGIPSLPGIQSWKRRAEAAKAAGSEYLNYQFGWAPLVSEVHSVVHAARNHRDIMQNYRHNEGRNVHRRFDFPSDVKSREEEIPSAYALGGINSTFLAGGQSAPTRYVSLVEETKRWFEGCFTYGGPSGADSFRRHLGYGSEADAVYGLELTPSVLWELTPWSWAVDWFTNAGDVIKNVTNFAQAGLVMRYGYMMSEKITTYSINTGSELLKCKVSANKTGPVRVGPFERGYQIVTKSRAAANPFGFGVGWEGLSPTQLAITAAIGITRLL